MNSQQINCNINTYSPRLSLKRSHIYCNDIPNTPQCSPEIPYKRLKPLDKPSIKLMSVINDDNEIIATGTPWEKCIDEYGNITWKTTVCFI